MADLLAWVLFALGVGHIAYACVKFKAPLLAAVAAGYRVTVRLEDGSTQNFDHAVDPVLPVGARVKIVDGAIVRRSTGNAQ
jgi:hypothetical protein